MDRFYEVNGYIESVRKFRQAARGNFNQFIDETLRRMETRQAESMRRFREDPELLDPLVSRCTGLNEKGLESNEEMVERYLQTLRQNRQNPRPPQQPRYKFPT